MLTASGRAGIEGMAGELSLSDRAAMEIFAIPSMVGKSSVAMFAAEAKGGACGMQYENYHWQLMGMIECVFGRYDGE